MGEFRSARKLPTVRRVAAYSATAPTTVSCVVNGGPHVRQEVRDRVLATMRALRCSSNKLARSLRSKTLLV